MFELKVNETNTKKFKRNCMLEFYLLTFNSAMHFTLLCIICALTLMNRRRTEKTSLLTYSYQGSCISLRQTSVFNITGLILQLSSEISDLRDF